MTDIPYALVPETAAALPLGLIVLQSDETIERDFQTLCAATDQTCFVTRIPSGPQVTPNMIAEMETALPSAAGLLPPGVTFASVGYGCTSGTAQIGPDRVAALIRSRVTTHGVAEPLTASIAALAALRAQRVALISPYTDDVAAPVASALTGAGITVAARLSFGVPDEALVARIDPASILAAIDAAARDTAVDAVFVSCTNLRAAEIAATAEARIGRPVVSSNLALAWMMFGQAGRALPSGPRLFETAYEQSLAGDTAALV